MFLVICAQDLHIISFGMFAEGRLIKQKRFDVSVPENYLALLDETLKEWEFPKNQLFEGVIVVTGPGAFTASRVSTTIANGFAFTQSIPVIGFSNPKFLDLESLLSLNSDVNMGIQFVIPTYNRSPNITRSNHKNF